MRVFCCGLNAKRLYAIQRDTREEKEQQAKLEKENGRFIIWVGGVY